MGKEELKKAIENGTAQVLTLDKVTALKGKRIIWSCINDRPQELIVGDIISEWDFNKNKPVPMTGYDSITAYWDDCYVESLKQQKKDSILLLNEKGEFSFIYCDKGSKYFDQPTFIYLLSDEDKCVYFIEYDE